MAQLGGYTYHDLGIENLDILANATTIFQGQPGGQTMFLESPAQFRIYGGAGGSGKTFAILLDSLRFIGLGTYSAIILRGMEEDILKLDGVWDESKKMFPYAGGTPKEKMLRWEFASGAKIEMAGVGREAELERWKSAQFAGLYFEEATELSEKQVRYMMGRNRSTAGIRPYIVATCNPVPDTWIHEFVKWYLLPEGTPDPLKRGVIRYFATVGEKFVFAESAEALCDMYDSLLLCDCTSYTFIYATLDDNPALIRNNPFYATSLKNTGGVQSERMLKGNWNAVPIGKVFKEEHLRYYYRPPPLEYFIITMDTASKTSDRNDYSVAQCWGKSGKNIYLLKQFRGKYTILPLYNLTRTFVGMCRQEYCVPFLGLNIEDASAGTQIEQLLRDDPSVNIPVRLITRRKDKYSRAVECSIYYEGGVRAC